jgi:hypothetical protein
VGLLAVQKFIDCFAAEEGFVVMSTEPHPNEGLPPSKAQRKISSHFQTLGFEPLAETSFIALSKIYVQPEVPAFLTAPYEE